MSFALGLAIKLRRQASASIVIVGLAERPAPSTALLARQPENTCCVPACAQHAMSERRGETRCTLPAWAVPRARGAQRRPSHQAVPLQKSIRSD
jgi:hypothetical protein